MISKQSETVLKFINSSSDNGKIHLEDVFDKFDNSLPRQQIIFSLQELADDKLVSLHVDDAWQTGFVVLQGAGNFYFENKPASPTVTKNQTININNSSNFNVGDNNVVNSTGADFSEVFEMIEQLDNANKEVIKETVLTLQDCIENSKPLPKSKLAKAIEITKDLLPICTALGKIFFLF